MTNGEKVVPLPTPAPEAENAPTDALSALEDLITADPSPETLAWVQKGFEAFVRGENLEVALGLVPQAAGQLSVRRRLQLKLRNDLLRLLIEDVYGGRIEQFYQDVDRFQATSFGRWYPCGPPPQATDKERLLYELLADYPAVPGRSRLYEILSG